MKKKIEATGNCVNSMVMRESLLRKIRFTRMVVPLSTSLTAVFNLCLNLVAVVIFFFFFQAEDGIRDYKVTRVQTCALPIWIVALDQDATIRASLGTQPILERES